MAVSGGGPDTQFNQNRLMADFPHVDGVLVYDPQNMDVSATVAPTLTRVAKGNWSWNRTAGGAETLNFRVSLGDMVNRLGELFNFQEYNAGSTNPSPGSQYQATGSIPSSNVPPPKGILLTDMFVIYTVGVANLTSANLRYGSSAYVNNVALAQTDIVAATAIATATQANPYVAVVPIPANVQAFQTLDTSIYELEAVFVMANTGTLAVTAIGCHCQFNYN